MTDANENDKLEAQKLFEMSEASFERYLDNGDYCAKDRWVLWNDFHVIVDEYEKNACDGLEDPVEYMNLVREVILAKYMHNTIAGDAASQLIFDTKLKRLAEMDGTLKSALDAVKGEEG